MTRTEERLTDALHAKAALITPGASGAPLPEPRPRRRAPAFLAPLGAAAAVVLVAAGIVLLNGAVRPGPRTAPALTGPSSVPRYYLADSGPVTIQVRSVATGRVTGQVDLPAKADYFGGVASAPGNQAFYVQVNDGNSGPRQTAIYSFHLTQTGKATPLRLVKSGMARDSDGPQGLAVSPDGSKLAVTVSTAPHSGDRYVDTPAYSDTIVVIDLRTGTQRQWRDPGPGIAGPQGGIGTLSWSDDQTVDFTVYRCQAIWLYCGPHTGEIRALSVASAGGGLTAHSRTVLDLSPYPDAVQVIADQQGHFTVLQVSQFDDFSKRATVSVVQVWADNSTRRRMLYRHGFAIGSDFGGRMWADPSGQHLILIVDNALSGWLDSGVLRPLPGLVASFAVW